MRKIKYVRFHSTSNHAPDIGELGPFLPSLSKTMADLNMLETDSGVEISYKNQQVLIPWGNVALAQFVVEPSLVKKSA